MISELCTQHNVLLIVLVLEGLISDLQNSDIKVCLEVDKRPTNTLSKYVSKPKFEGKKKVTYMINILG